MTAETGIDPYERARRNYQDDRDRINSDRTRWFVIAVLTTLMAASATGFAVWTAARSEYVPYIVAIDDVGRAELAPRVATTSDIPDLVMKREMRTFIERARSIPADETILRRELRRLFAYIPDGSPAFTFLRTRYQGEDTNPFLRAATETVEVDVSSVTFVSGQTYRVEWVETVAARTTGRVLASDRYVGTLVMGDRAIVDASELQDNPLGLTVEYIDIQRVEMNTNG